MGAMSLHLVMIAGVPLFAVILAVLLVMYHGDWKRYSQGTDPKDKRKAGR